MTPAVCGGSGLGLSVLLVGYSGSIASGQTVDVGSGLVEFVDQLETFEAVTPQPLGVEDEVSLGDVLSSVRDHHPKVRIAEQEVAAASADVRAARGGFDTKFSAKGRAAPLGYYDWGSARVGVEQPTSLWGATVQGGWRIGRGNVPGYYGQYETLDAGEWWVGAQVPLLRDGAIDSRRAKRTKAILALSGAESSFQEQLLELSLSATRAYWKWVAAGHKYQVAEQMFSLALTRDGQLLAKYRAGSGAAFDVAENRQLILSRQQARVRARRAFEEASYTLSLYLRDESGMPRVMSMEHVPLEWAFEGLGEQPLAEQDQDPRLKRALEQALRLRPIFAMYRALVEQKSVEVDLARNGRLPQLDLALEASSDLGSESDEVLERLEPFKVEGFATFSTPLQGRTLRGRLDGRTADLRSAEEKARWVRDQVMAEIRDAFSALRAASEVYGVAVRNASLAERLAASERQRFDLGMTTLFTVNQRERMAAAAQAKQVEATLLGHIARARWVRVQGLPPGETVLP